MTELNQAVDKVLSNINTNKPYIIKRYNNRKLYDTTKHTYINIADLENLMKSNNNVKVIDNSSKKDITNISIGVIIAHKVAKKPQLNKNILDYVSGVLEGV